MSRIDEALADARDRLRNSPSPRADAETLLAHVVGRDRAWLRAWPEATLDAGQAARYSEWVRRRARGEPVAYLVGRRGFHDLDFIVTPAVLIPRPETELLVDLACREIDAHDPGARVLDLGTGCGCVALAIAHARPESEVTAVEASADALAIAGLNAERLGLERVRLVAGDWFSGLGRQRFDVIVANPPYVAAGDPHLRHGDLRFEPRSALVAGSDGLDAIREIATGVGNHLAPDGVVAVEHGHDQGERVRALFEAEGLDDVTTLADLAGHDRVTRGRAAPLYPRGDPGSPAWAWR